MEEMARLTDEFAIRTLIARIAILADEGDLDEYVEQFTENAAWDFPLGPRNGRDDILTGARERRAAGTSGPGSCTRHVLTNVAVQVGDDDTATAVSYFMFVQGKSSPPSIASLGVYRDTFVRQDTTWLLSQRRITVDS